MRIAITGGTGFIGSHLADALVQGGHEVVLVARGVGGRAPPPGRPFHRCPLDDVARLTGAFGGCDAVAHLAGINRETGPATFERIHVAGTRNVVTAARRAGARRVALLSFLKARPGCGSPYHESKWAAEEIVRASGLETTILKPGMIYGPGDHMLDHITRALRTFPVFAHVGFRDQPIRPTAVEDVVRILVASLIEGRLDGRTVRVLGPERLTLREAVTRIEHVAGRRVRHLRLPIWFHRILAWVAERTMRVPLVSAAQLRMLREGMDGAAPGAGELPDDLIPAARFDDSRIRAGLPEAGPFGLRDCRCCRGWRPAVTT